MGGFTGSVDNNDAFAVSVEGLGDLDGDGNEDIAVGAYQDDDGGADRGAVWILFLNDDGTVKSHEKISSTVGGFTGSLDNGDIFGHDVSNLGDLDGDGVVDLAVSGRHDDDGGTNRGAVWILFLNADGTVKSHQKISDTEGGFTGLLENDDYFGISVAGIGDLDGDGILDLAAGANGDDDGGASRGAVWILFLHADGTVKSHQKISDTAGDFSGILDGDDFFGWDLCGPGDLDGDGLVDLAAGATGDDDGGLDRRGAVWILFLNANGTVKSHQKISQTEGNFSGALDHYDQFGSSVASLGDLDGDGMSDLAVGAPSHDDGGINRGAVWLLLLERGVSDVDGDGVEDGVDNCPNDSNPGQSDTDLDGVGDACDSDDDDDGVVDIDDNCQFTANADQIDLDMDGLGDPCDADVDGDGVCDDPAIQLGCTGGPDNCPTEPNEFQTDTDLDGAGDECDADDDDDGVCDTDQAVTDVCAAGPDNCPTLDNPDQADSPDGDGIGDLCDADDDNDGANDDDDNCPVTANADQNDTDNDGAGDACDSDDDNDGVADADDNCPFVSNGDQADADGDGIGDACNDADDLDGDEWSDALDNCPDVGRTPIRPTWTATTWATPAIRTSTATASTTAPICVPQRRWAG